MKTVFVKFTRRVTIKCVKQRKREKQQYSQCHDNKHLSIDFFFIKNKLLLLLWFWLLWLEQTMHSINALRSENKANIERCIGWFRNTKEWRSTEKYFERCELWMGTNYDRAVALNAQMKCIQTERQYFCFKLKTNKADNNRHEKHKSKIKII